MERDTGRVVSGEEESFAAPEVVGEERDDAGDVRASPGRATVAAGSGSAGTTQPRPTGTAQPGASSTAGAGKLPVGPGTKGVTDDTILIGIPYADPTDNAAANAGYVGTDPGAFGNFSGDDARRSKQVIVDYINAHGGLGGRQIEPVYRQNEGTTPQIRPSGREREEQAMCATWTEDHQVFAMAAGYPGGYGTGEGLSSEGVLLECAMRTQTPLITAQSVGELPVGEDTARRAGPLFYRVSGPTVERREVAVVEGLIGEGFFAGDARVGLMIQDSPDVRKAAEEITKARLAAHGVRVVREIYYYDNIDSPWQNYVLQMQTAGVTHVVYSNTYGNVLGVLFFMRAAENQQYRPYYGLGSDNIR